MKKRQLKISFLFISVLFIIMPVKAKATMKIVIDPGHGGTDSGAIYGGYYEKDLTLQTSRYLRDYLKDYDVEIIMTHEGIWGWDLSVYDRSMIARNKNADLLVCMHYNSGTNGARGAEVYVTDTWTGNYRTITSQLGNKILANLSAIGIPNRGVKTRLLSGSDATDIYTDGHIADYYGIIRYAMRGCKIDWGVISPAGAKVADIRKGEGVATILVEHCFMQGDYSYIDSDWDLWKIAEADGKAIVSQYGLRKKSEIVSSVTLDQNEISMILGDTSKLTATVLPATATNKSVTWTSSDSDIVSVDSNGNIVAKNFGTATIKATTVDGDKIAECRVNVDGTNISISAEDILMSVGDTSEIKSDISYLDKQYKLVYTSENPEIATVTEDGRVKGISEGMTNVKI